jgi:hypothetical protein
MSQNILVLAARGPAKSDSDYVRRWHTPMGRSSETKLLLVPAN